MMMGGGGVLLQRHAKGSNVDCQRFQVEVVCQLDSSWIGCVECDGHDVDCLWFDVEAISQQVLFCSVLL